MSDYKVYQFVNKEFEGIIKDSREYRAYELGVATGWFELYRYIKTEIGEKTSKEYFKHPINGESRISEYFNKLIELDKEQNTEAEEVIEKLNKHYNKL